MSICVNHHHTFSGEMMFSLLLPIFCFMVFSKYFKYMWGTIFIFPQLRKIYQRECYDKTYGIGAACLTQFIVEIPFLISMSLIITTLIFFMAGLTSSVNVWANMWASLCLNIACASGIAYCLSAFADTLAGNFKDEQINEFTLFKLPMHCPSRLCYL